MIEASLAELWQWAGPLSCKRKVNQYCCGSDLEWGLHRENSGVDTLKTGIRNSTDCGQQTAAAASSILGRIGVLLSFVLGATELAGIDLDRVALPAGLLLFAVAVGIRVWARFNSVDRLAVCAQAPANIV